ncbi:6002_t:CDS:2, partial [Scutellospora calospora]
SLVTKRLYRIILKRKIADSFTVNERKCKYAEDEIYTNSRLDNDEQNLDNFEVDDFMDNNFIQERLTFKNFYIFEFETDNILL